MSDEPEALTLKATLTYDAEQMHSGDKDAEARDWFLSEVLMGGNLTLFDSGEVGDSIGALADVEIVARDEASDNGLRNAVTAFVDKHFVSGSKANRPDYWVVGVTSADVYTLREALYAAKGTTPLQDHEGRWPKREAGAPVVARDEAAELRAALAFAQSVIKGGESWSPTCDEIIGGALAATEGSE